LKYKLVIIFATKIKNTGSPVIQGSNGNGNRAVSAKYPDQILIINVQQTSEKWRLLKPLQELGAGRSG
jgi:hypothetical protein